MFCYIDLSRFYLILVVDHLHLNIGLGSKIIWNVCIKLYVAKNTYRYYRYFSLHNIYLKWGTNLNVLYPTHDGWDSSKNNWDGPLYCEDAFHWRDGIRQPYYVRIGALELDVLQLSRERTNSSKFMIGWKHDQVSTKSDSK